MYLFMYRGPLEGQRPLRWLGVFPLPRIRFCLLGMPTRDENACCRGLPGGSGPIRSFHYMERLAAEHLRMELGTKRGKFSLALPSSPNETWGGVLGYASDLLSPLLPLLA